MDPSELRRLAGRRKIALGILEKDQAVTVALGVLADLSRSWEIVFKGGTALGKVYFPDYRFSEDLDFTASAGPAEAILGSEDRFLEAGERAGVRFLRLERVPGGRVGRTLKLRYADMNDHPNHLRLEISLREKVLLPALPQPIQDPYRVLAPDARIPTMALPEIAAEKVRALLMRRQARDLYDLGSLVRHGVPVDIALVEAKLAWWRKGMAFRPEELISRMEHLRATWERDLSPLVLHPPRFDSVEVMVRDALQRAIS